MRAPNFLLISLLVGMPLCLPAHAISFQTRLEKVEWTVEGDQFLIRDRTQLPKLSSAARLSFHRFRAGIS